MEVEDVSGKTDILMFDHHAQKLLKVTADDYMKSFDSEKGKIPPSLNVICNKTFVFKVKVDGNNMDKGKLSFTICRIFPMPSSMLSESTISGSKVRNLVFLNCIYV